MTSWAALFRDADERELLAVDDKRRARGMRCQEVDSNGHAQCTADADPAHEHRYRDEDLPGYDPDLY